MTTRKNNAKVYNQVSSIMYEGDFFIVRDKSTIQDIKEYIEVKEAGAMSKIWWDAIKNLHVTDAFRTIGSIANAYMSIERPIPVGVYSPPLSFVRYVYSQLIKTNQL